MNYHDLTHTNQGLYAELEELTVEIAFMKLRGLEDDIERLQHQKDGIRELIDMNLEDISKIWETEGLSYRKASRVASHPISSETEKRIIELFKNNPDMRQRDIALNAGVSLCSVSNILTNYLTLIYERTSVNE